MKRDMKRIKSDGRRMASRRIVSLETLDSMIDDEEAKRCMR